MLFLLIQDITNYSFLSRLIIDYSVFLSMYDFFCCSSSFYPPARLVSAIVIVVITVAFAVCCLFASYAIFPLVFFLFLSLSRITSRVSIKQEERTRTRRRRRRKKDELETIFTLINRHRSFYNQILFLLSDFLFFRLYLHLLLLLYGYYH